MLKGLWLRPSVVKEGRIRRLYWLEDSRFNNINQETLSLSILTTMQFGNSLDLIV